MTTIHFHYTDSYNNPSRGSLAFMPHRRHAANETEVLPKPFTIPLLNGEVTVNLQPNSSSWVWIVTEYFEGVSKSFYTTVPDRDGVMEHTELIRISPSSIPAPYDAVEPAWWAEMRQYKTTVSDTLLKSGEALAQAEHAIETGKESVERTQHNASVAGAYADESRQSAYDAREYRDEAEQWRNEAQEQADRAATGPESAAARAEDAATRAEQSETRARNSEDEARASAAEARSSETNATGAASTATERASDARNEANRAESEANRAKSYADELMDGPREYVDQAREARDDAQGYAADAQSAVTAAQGHAETAQTEANRAATEGDRAVDEANRSESAATAAQGHAETAQTEANRMAQTMANGPWHPLPLVNEWEALASSAPGIQCRITAAGLQFRGSIRYGTDAHFANLPNEILDIVDANPDWSISSYFAVGAINSDDSQPAPLVDLTGSGVLRLQRPRSGYDGLNLYFDGVIISLD